MWELTVPWEENMEEANEKKKLKCDDLLRQCRSNGWKGLCLHIEIRARGFTARSPCETLSNIGVIKKKVEQLNRYPIQPKGLKNGYG